MDNKLLREYKKFEDKAKEIEAKRKELREQIVDELQKRELKKMETKYGTFTVGERTNYTYSESVIELEKKAKEKIKLAKVKEEKQGIATPEKKNYLVYTPIKVTV